MYGPLSSEVAQHKVRIFNPDGSEAEKSGNGLRIFSRYLREKDLVHDNEKFNIETIGGVVEAVVFDEGRMVQVDMGKVSFSEVMNQQISVDNRTFDYYAASIGNPHCVIPVEELTPELAKHYGPLIEIDSRFPSRTNVQFMKVLDRNSIQLEIWERGAGYTLASGSSSCAATAVARRLGLCDADITVHMPGGDLSIHVAEDYTVRMTGPVTKVMHGTLSDEVFDR